MNRSERFFRSMAMLCLGIIIGFLISPIKKGIRVTIGSGNTGSKVMNETDWDDMDDFDDYYYDEGPYEKLDDETAPFQPTEE